MTDGETMEIDRRNHQLRMLTLSLRWGCCTLVALVWLMSRCDYSPAELNVARHEGYLKGKANALETCIENGGGR